MGQDLIGGSHKRKVPLDPWSLIPDRVLRIILMTLPSFLVINYL